MKEPVWQNVKNVGKRVVIARRYQDGFVQIDKIKSFSDSTKFIERYFEVADKKAILIQEREQMLHKSAHVVSAYFLGALINQALWPYNVICEKKTDMGFTSNILFVWFLTCLYHDYYWNIENKKELCVTCPNISKFQKSFNIGYSLLKRKPRFIPDRLKKSIENYYEYRIREWNLVDHGIAGGVIMFDKLITNRKRQKKGPTSGIQPSPLDFSKPIEKFYVEASYAVATHNIFFPNKDTVPIYEKYNLNSLISQDPISYKEAPFLFFLGLVDTIDPIKTFDCADPDYVARHLYIDIQEENNTYAISLLVKQPLNYEKIAAKKRALESWLKLDFDCQPKDRKVVISFGAD